jgi:N-formylglutamate amidohydrolase
LDYIFDVKEREKFRMQELQSQVTDIYNKYDNQLKDDLAKLAEGLGLPQEGVPK